MKDFNELVYGKTGEDLDAGYAAVRACIEAAVAPVLDDGEDSAKAAMGSIMRASSPTCRPAITCSWRRVSTRREKRQRAAQAKDRAEASAERWCVES